MKNFVLMSDFENDIESYSFYNVRWENPHSHMFVSASFTEVRILLSKLPMLLFKNNDCEVHIHNIHKVSKAKRNLDTIYTLHCLDLTRQQAHTNTCMIICR